MKKKLLAMFALGAVMLSPMYVFAANTTFDDLLNLISGLINKIIPILIAFMVFLLILGIVQFTTSADEEKHEKARKLIISAFIGLVIIICIWGIVRILVNTVGTDNTLYTDFPEIPCYDGYGDVIPC